MLLLEALKGSLLYLRFDLSNPKLKHMANTFIVSYNGEYEHNLMF